MSFSKEIVFLVLQFLDEEKFKDSVHSLEKESGCFFSMRYFEELIINGEWEALETYLSGFTKVDDNRYSIKLFFEIRKHKYLEALDKKDRVKAMDILINELKVFSTFNDAIVKEMTELIIMDNFRDNPQLFKYGDMKSARITMFKDLKVLIEANPLIKNKLTFPGLKNSRLKTLLNQSFNWQNQLCKNSNPNPNPNPDRRTMLTDHSCSQPQTKGARGPSPVTNQAMSAMPTVGVYPPLVAHGPYPAVPAHMSSCIGGWMNPSSVPHPSMSVGQIGFTAPNNTVIPKRPRTPPTNTTALDSEHTSKRTRTLGMSDEQASNHVLPVGYTPPSNGQSSNASDELPKDVVMTLNMGSFVKTMDFNPLQQCLLLVGTNTGEIMLWELGKRVKLVVRNFKVWNLGACSTSLQAFLANDNTASVNRVIWSADGSLFGVAYSKNIVHVYSYNGRGDDIRDHLEIDAHVGSVNDIAFSYPKNQLSIVTCGDDRLIKVWDAVTGARKFIFEGHEAPVFSVYPHQKNGVPFTFSTATDGKIKAWLYENGRSRVDYDAPGHASITMIYSTDGTRLFSCGTSKEGISCLVEWNETEGIVKRNFQGLGKKSIGVVQFDSTKNRFLVVGDESKVKFWDMDNANVLVTTDADGGLPSSPCVRFNKEGTLLAVSADDNSIKVLANMYGKRLLRTIESIPFHNSNLRTSSVAKAPMLGTSGGAIAAPAGPSMMDHDEPLGCIVNGDSQSLADVKSMIWKLTEIKESSQCRSLKLPDNLTLAKVSMLAYTNSGLAIIALSVNAVHKIWKWQKNDRNLTGKPTADAAPQVWQPTNGILMTNITGDTNPEDKVSCFAISKNESYVVSASGGEISLFNMATFKTMITFMPSPSSATYLAFQPHDNNVVAIGMEDSSIQIYNVRVDEVMNKLEGHQKRITSIAFSNVLNVMVSADADSQICVWRMDGWEKQTSKYLQLPNEHTPAPLADTIVQFHQDQIHLLVANETQIAIYEAPMLERLKQWFPRQENGPITHATYSCDSLSIFISFEDGSISVLTSSTLLLRCRIHSSAYLPTNPSNSRPYPVAIAAHPSDANQFALGLNDGRVYIVEPLESEGKWGIPPPNENGGASPSHSRTGAVNAVQSQR